MKYFLLKTDAKYSSPQLIDWYGKVNPKHIHKGVSYAIPRRQIIYVESNPNICFTDVISSPIFLVSPMVRDIMKMYEPQIVFKEIILLDQKNRLTQLYLLPIFEEILCLSSKSILNLDHSVIKKAVLLEEAVTGKHIFRIEDVNNTYVVADLDFVESILRRGAKGITLTELDMDRRDVSYGVLERK